MKIITIIILTALSNFSVAQDPEVRIKTSAICEMCEYTIEKDMAFEKGVKSAALDLETKELIVSYNPKKTSLDQIRLRITQIGYDADSLLRDEVAHSKLPYCCQSDDKRIPLQDHSKGDE
ncbi:MAG: mercuric ion binding protein [Marinoscillum sp.]|jgi:mercuric ion binding protein